MSEPKPQLKRRVAGTTMTTTGLYIDGRWREASSEQMIRCHGSFHGHDSRAGSGCDPARRRGRSRSGPRCPSTDGRRPRLVSEPRSCAARSNSTRKAAEDIALTMTLEMGKPLAESRGEVAYGAEFLRWFSEEAARISGRYSTAPDGQEPTDGRQTTGRPMPVHHAVEFPTGHGHPKDCTRHRRWMHHGVEAGGAHPAHRTALHPDSGRGRASAPGVLNVISDHDGRSRHRPAHRRSQAAQTLIHRLDRGGQAG